MAQDTVTEKRASETVTVGCKLPNGLHCDIKQAGQPVERFTLAGTNGSRVIGGFGITRDVPRKSWERWLALNEGLDFVKNGFVFAMGQAESVESKAKELASMRNGMEPKDPEAPAAGITKADKA